MQCRGTGTAACSTPPAYRPPGGQPGDERGGANSWYESALLSVATWTQTFKLVSDGQQASFRRRIASRQLEVELNLIVSFFWCTVCAVQVDTGHSDECRDDGIGIQLDDSSMDVMRRPSDRVYVDFLMKAGLANRNPAGICLWARWFQLFWVKNKCPTKEDVHIEAQIFQKETWPLSYFFTNLYFWSPHRAI